MSVKSLKLIKSLDKLPSYFKQANASFLRFKEYHSKDPLISYFAGLYTVQILIDLIITKDTISGKPLVNDEKDITAHLVTVLENERVKIEKNQDLKAILESHQSSREYILNFTNEPFETATTLIETGQISGKTVTDLLNCAALYEIGRGLFPYQDNELDISSNNKDEDDIEQNVETQDDSEEKLELNLPDVPKGNEISKEDDTTEKNNGDGEQEEAKESGISKDEEIDSKDQDQEKNEKLPSSNDDDLTSSLAKLVQSATDETNIEDHISQSIKDLSTENYQDQISKEDEIIDKIINSDFNKVTDEELDERIQYCKTHAQRIITAVKKGENPQISSNSIESKPISNEDIEKVIKFALNEPDEEEQNEIKFPELPTSIPDAHPNENHHNEEDDHEAEETAYSDSDTEDHKPASKAPKPTHKQLEKEDIEQFLQDGELLNNAAKNAKFAISAINYEDVDTAIAQLNKSLAFLQQYKDRK